MGKAADTLMVFPYGLHANVPAEALALLFSIQGNPDNRAAIAWDAKVRPTLEEGEVAFYHPASGGLVVWRNSGNLEIITTADISASCGNLTAEASGNVSITAGGNAEVTATLATITAPTITLAGNVVIQGGLSMAGGGTADMGTGTITHNGKVIDSTHGHVQGNDSGGSTEQPISGVT